jgi:hypothetical protein
MGLRPTHGHDTLAHLSFRAERGICFCRGAPREREDGVIFDGVYRRGICLCCERQADSSLRFGMTG